MCTWPQQSRDMAFNPDDYLKPLASELKMPRFYILTGLAAFYICFDFD